MQLYGDLPGFEHIYLEDSFVLDVEAHPGVVYVDVDAVLRESHPLYERPPASEMFAFVDRRYGSMTCVAFIG
jgi:hypothetical protein